MHGAVKSTCLLLLSLLAGVSSAAAQAVAPATPPAALGLDEVIRRAEANEPTFAAAQAQRRITALQRKDARAGLLPSATFHNQFLFTESNHTHTTLGTVGGQYDQQGNTDASLPIFIANNSVHEYYSQGVVNETLGLAQVGAVRLADANAALAAAQFEIARRGLVATVVSLFYGVTADTQKASIAQRALAEADHFVTITQERETAREAAHADVIKAQIQQAQRQRELADARLAARKAQLELGILLFPDPSSPFSLAPPGDPVPLPERAVVESAARLNNPELRSALASVAASRADTLNAQAALLPDLALNFTYGIDAPQFATTGYGGARNLGYSASATVDLPLWDWFTSTRKVRESRIRADAAKLALTAAQRRLLADLAEFYAEADTARQQLTSLETTVSEARESLRLTNLRYVDGESTVLEVVDAQNTLISAENALADGNVRYQLALAQLQTLTGKL